MPPRCAPGVDSPDERCAATDLNLAEREIVCHDNTMPGRCAFENFARTSMDGMMASFVTFPDRGPVVSVISNIWFADTASLVLKIAPAFAEPRKSPARK